MDKNVKDPSMGRHRTEIKEVRQSSQGTWMTNRDGEVTVDAKAMKSASKQAKKGKRDGGQFRRLSRDCYHLATDHGLEVLFACSTHLKT